MNDAPHLLLPLNFDYNEPHFHCPSRVLPPSVYLAKQHTEKNRNTTYCATMYPNKRLFCLYLYSTSNVQETSKSSLKIIFGPNVFKSRKAQE